MISWRTNCVRISLNVFTLTNVAAKRWLINYSKTPFSASRCWASSGQVSWLKRSCSASPTSLSSPWLRSSEYRDSRVRWDRRSRDRERLRRLFREEKYSHELIIFKRWSGSICRNYLKFKWWKSRSSAQWVNIQKLVNIKWWVNIKWLVIITEQILGHLWTRIHERSFT